MTIEEVKVPRFHHQLDTPRDIGQMRIAGPKTFRRACKMLWGSKRKNLPYSNFGGNRQNINKKMRIVWEADKGYKFVQADQSGADALCVALLCSEGKYRQLFRHGIKPHTYVALKLFKEEWKKHYDSAVIEQLCILPIEELVKHPEFKAVSKLIKSSDDWEASKRFYYIAKKVVHAGSYGMMGNRMVDVVHEETGGEMLLSKQDADKYIMFFKLQEFPEITSWNIRVGVEAEKYKVIRNLFGFPFQVTGKINSNDVKDLIAWAPQSTVAIITEQAVIKLQDYIEEHNKDWHILAETHDSILCECPESEVQECGKIMSEFLAIELTSPVDGWKWKMKSEVVCGKNWSPKIYHKDGSIENIDGLDELKLVA